VPGYACTLRCWHTATNLRKPVLLWFCSLTCSSKEPLMIYSTTFLQAGCPSCYPTSRAYAGCLQIQPNFQKISRRHFNKTLTPRSHWSCLPDGLYLISADNYWPAMLIHEINDSVYQVNVTIIRNTHSHHHLPNNWTGSNFYDWMSLLSFHQLRISKRTN